MFPTFMKYETIGLMQTYFTKAFTPAIVNRKRRPNVTAILDSSNSSDQTIIIFSF